MFPHKVQQNCICNKNTQKRQGKSLLNMRQLYQSNLGPSITESLKISSFSWYYHHYLQFSYFFVDDAYKTCGVQNVHTQTISSNFQESLIVLLEWLLAEQITLEYNNQRKEKKFKKLSLQQRYRSIDTTPCRNHHG